MKIPSVVVFDLGKVLVDFDYRLAVERIAARCSQKNQNLWQLVSPEAKFLIDYETGLLTTEQFYEAVREKAGFQGDLAEFSHLFSDIFWPIEPMIAWQEKLRTAGIPTYIFSNTNPLAAIHIRARFPFFSHFTGYILSYEHQSMKPAARIYEVVEQMTGKSGSDILYLDDRLENVEAGAKRGWQTILQETPEKTLRQVVELGLPVAV